MCFKIKTHVKQIYQDRIGEGFRKEEYATKRTIECQTLLGSNHTSNIHTRLNGSLRKSY